MKNTARCRRNLFSIKPRRSPALSPNGRTAKVARLARPDQGVRARHKPSAFWRIRETVPGNGGVCGVSMSKSDRAIIKFFLRGVEGERRNRKEYFSFVRKRVTTPLILHSLTPLLVCFLCFGRQMPESSVSRILQRIPSKLQGRVLAAVVRLALNVFTGSNWRWTSTSSWTLWLISHLA